MTALQTLTVLESNQLLDWLLRDTGTGRQKRLGIRNYTMGCLMLDAGLRVGELVSLSREQLVVMCVPVTSLTVQLEQTKTKTERTIPLSQRIRHALEKMQRHWWKQYTSNQIPFAFYSSARIFPLTVRQVERIISGASTAAIGRPIHPHILRHTFATRLMRTTSIRVVQELLGHKQLTSTQIYTHPNQKDYQKAIESLEKGD